MATEIYTPPQELPVTTVVYRSTDVTGTTVYEDPNKVLFLGSAQMAGQDVTIVVA